jgi:hypothetical protein
MGDLYVLKDGRHLGPLTTDAVARAMVEGSIPRDVLVAPPGAARWLHASQMPELLVALATALKSVPPPAPQAQGARPQRVPGVDTIITAPAAWGFGKGEQAAMPVVNIPPAVPGMPVYGAPSPSVDVPQRSPAPPPLAARVTMPATSYVPSPAAIAVDPSVPLDLTSDAALADTKAAVANAEVAPWPAWLPWAIFGAFVAATVVEVVVATSAH